MRGWGDLRRAVREAHLLGATFSIVGAEVAIAGDLPDDLRDRLEPGMLRQYLGAVQDDRDAIAFLHRLGVEAVQVADIAGAEEAMRELTGSAAIGMDIETAPPDGLVVTFAPKVPI